MKLIHLSCILGLTVFAQAQAPKFELRDGDRVLLLGDALLERENSLGYLEARMHAAWPTTKFTVRNLSWAGDTPKGWSRASFDGPAKGYERLKEQIALVKPTVVFLGYGMAASLQEMTDRSNDIMLNRDPARYGEEPMSAARFKKELGELMTDIEAIGEKPRFVLLSPIKHEDLRKARPGMTDPTKHNELLAGYAKATIELASERNAIGMDMFTNFGPERSQGQHTDWQKYFTENGIHLTPYAYEQFAGSVTGKLKQSPKKGERIYPDESFYEAILRKNDLFFHRTRPANSTYLFGFRKHEQGRNAVEIPQFDPLVDAVDAEIDGLKRKSASSSSGNTGPAPKADPSSSGNTGLTPKADPSSSGNTGLTAKADPSSSGSTGLTPKAAPSSPGNTGNGQNALPLPNFTMEEGYEITLWADTNLVGKPVGMNWDAAGRLWVACSPVYPQIKPGAHPEDKVVVIEDTDKDGKADKSTTFATDLLIAAGVAPDFGVSSGQSAVGSGQSDNGGNAKLPTDNRQVATSPNAAYVGASTELVHVTDTDGDGKADQRRVVLSGFGTEDTHHTIHTLKWGPDGRLYFNQSIYIHSHLETPYGMVRVNSGAIMAYDPRTERTEVIAKGWCNPWGHVWDEWGQQFTTDGAGGQGISWLVQGAMYFTYENARKIMPSVSPGSYPKFCGLEIVRSPLFPAEWQGNFITCDFRAHRIARFSMKDLSPAKSGYETKAEADLVRTTDSSFRPIDVKMGPDGALYVADWTNPVINHGEVDFRDPRRDHVNGRIWRIAPKGKTPLKWESLVGRSSELLKADAASGNAWAIQNARMVSAADEFRYASVVPFAPLVADDNWVSRLSNADKLSSKERAITARQLPLFARSIADYRNLAIADAKAREAREASKATKLKEKTVEMKNLEEQLKKSKGDAESRELIQKKKALGEEIDRLKPFVDWCGTGRPPTPDDFQKEYDRFVLSVIRDTNPRVRVEAMRALCRIPTAESAALVLEAAVNGGSASALPAAPGGQFTNSTAAADADTHYAYTAWLSVNDLAPQVMEYVEKLAADPASAAKQQAAISFALQALPADKTGPLLSKIVAKNGAPKDGPWIELIGQAGGPAEAEKLLAQIAEPRAAAALIAAARRGVKPPGASLDVIKSAPAAVKADALRLAGLWKLDAVEFITASMNGASQPVIDASFDALATLRTPAAATTLEALLAKGDAGQRRRAIEALATFKPDSALAGLSAVAADGDDAAKLALFRSLFQSETFKGKFVKAVPADLPKPAAAAALRAARELGRKGEALVAALTPIAGAPAPASNAGDIAAMVTNVQKNGNPVEGETIYRRLALACTACHAIGGAGGKVGPDMTTIGASAPLDYLIESLYVPNAKVKEGYNAVAFSLKGGRAANGVLLRETPDAVFLRDAAGNETSVPKADITARENVGSIMPAGLLNTLTDREKAHVFAFMAQLGKPGPFDATKASVARVWWLYPGKDVEAVVSGKIATPGAKTLTNVDGRLTKAMLTEALQMVPESGDTFVGVAKFAGTGKTRLNMQGVTKAWLDGAPLAIASNPSPEVELSPGNHTLVVKLDTKQLPEVLRADCPEGRFATE
ncbi:MAG: hypothetical protein RL088_2883 [Verrucomicrobiota bacterium]|jgi:putative heme-binding domain-containing protein